MNTVELIKGEIKRLKEYKFNRDGWTYAYQEGLNKIEEFINSLQEEPKFKTGNKVMLVEEPVSEELEKAADKYSENIESDYPNDMFDRCGICNAFKAGAQWQKQQLLSNTY